MNKMSVTSIKVMQKHMKYIATDEVNIIKNFQGSNGSLSGGSKGSKKKFSGTKEQRR